MNASRTNRLANDGVEIVLEATGLLLLKQLLKHLHAGGAKKVVITFLVDQDVKTVVLTLTTIFFDGT